MNQTNQTGEEKHQSSVPDSSPHECKGNHQFRGVIRSWESQIPEDEPMNLERERNLRIQYS